MSFTDFYRLSAHAVITNDSGDILLLKASYGEQGWGLPGGALDMGETVHQALIRECQEELGCEIVIEHLTGIYYHSAFNSHAFIFRVKLLKDALITLSDEHLAYRYCAFTELSPVQQHRVAACLNYTGTVDSAAF
ncbi:MULTISPECIES: NUDIX hydrolase [Pseudoalteromonas]|uniref:NUDIX domain-containing protein n=1 Tax=Pseudoalteromonas haloplanktis TaxID=228 RepID=A0ABU1BB13_PSEHA|nr:MULTISPECIES: NUDIX domain-containing protein [Pseudoalteromonas]MCF6146774.1 hypothetical protein [Pseudoalteromonas mariniglutinosa NCIMB 1770]MDQ9091714.1 NUDIX domain-containing protein [Pseudoalteromonas haloplanktis]TMN73234.1 NUDIX domain-containing protein [Pseudoalteromonas sp. S1727]